LSHLQGGEDRRLADFIGSDEAGELGIDAEAMRRFAAKPSEPVDPGVGELYGW